MRKPPVRPVVPRNPREYDPAQHKDYVRNERTDGAYGLWTDHGPVKPKMSRGALVSIVAAWIFLAILLWGWFTS